jgi:hypothetical protein
MVVVVQPNVPLPIGRLPDSTRIVLLRRRHSEGAQAVWGCGKWRAECRREGHADYSYRVWDTLTGEVVAKGQGRRRAPLERECLAKLAEISGGKVEEA